MRIAPNAPCTYAALLPFRPQLAKQMAGNEEQFHGQCPNGTGCVINAGESPGTNQCATFVPGRWNSPSMIGVATFTISVKSRNPTEKMPAAIISSLREGKYS